MAEDGNVLELREVAKAYAGGPPVIDIARFELPRASRMVLAGESGSGKTTFLNLVSGILDPDRGEVLIDGVDMVKLSGRARDAHRGEKIGFVFQTFNLLQGFTAIDNLRVAMLFGRTPRGERRSRAEHLLERVGLKEHLDKKPGQLSVGQQQRVGIARALVNKPPLVLADEPAAQLDKANAERVIALLKEVCEEHKAALLVVAHDQIVLDQFDKVVQIQELNRKP
jgi:putative ABC transport system ATP-binding protein